ncbi:MAG: hypothetical protein PCFJNLEI_02687 [Verrucomicrobiae bacterium]|nr:hypothetical protein [Verrucomicrobiae bacterium]
MNYITEVDREQGWLLPERLEDYGQAPGATPDSPHFGGKDEIRIRPIAKINFRNGRARCPQRAAGLTAACGHAALPATGMRK